MNTSHKIAILGGTGKEGTGLALRWAARGHEVIIGSRTAERAQAVVAQIAQQAGAGGVMRGAVNLEAALAASLVVLAVPYAAQVSTATAVAAALEGKILIDVTAPLVPPRVDRVQLPEGGSAVEALQRRLGGGVKVVSAFQNVSAAHLRDVAHAIDCDVLVCGDDAAACETVIGLVEDAGMRGLYAGVLANSVAAEALTSVLIAINKRYKVAGSGIRITAVPGR